MCTSEDIGAEIHYTDTDSMHIQANKVKPLADAFRKKYGRELFGKGLGQFRSDFEADKSYHIVDRKLVKVGKSVKVVGEPCEGSRQSRACFRGRSRTPIGSKTM